MLVLIDNYDSFSYNLVQAISGQGIEVRVFRNDAIKASEVMSMDPTAIVVSPGPCSPKQAGISVELIRLADGKIPLLGVCLGHQCIGEAFGATVAGAQRIMHGKTSMVTHDKSALYRGIKNPFPAGRYHSLAIIKSTLPETLMIDATSDDGEIMGVRHREHAVYGVQFHPESVLTPSGKRLIRNFLQMSGCLKVDDVAGTEAP